MEESEQSITPADNSNRPLPKKKRLRDQRFERELIGMMKNKRTCENLKKILAPLIQEMVQEGLKCQSPPPVPRSPAYQIQEPDVLCLHLHFKNTLPDPLFTGTSFPPAEIVIRRGNSEETVVSGPSSSISVKMVVLYGDFEREGWTAKDFQDNVVCPREGRGPLLTRKEGKVVIALKNGVGTFRDLQLTDNSSWTRSRKFRLGVEAVRGRGIQDRIMEARSEAFVVREKRGESSQKRDFPLLGDEIWRLKNIRENGVYFKKLTAEGIKTVQQFLQFFIINPGHLQKILGMKKQKWEETLGHAQKCIKDGKYYIYSCIERKSMLLLNSIYEVVGVTFDNYQNFQNLDNLPPSDKNLVENLKKQAYENRGRIIEYNEQPVFGHSNPHIQAAGIFPSNPDLITHQYNEQPVFGHSNPHIQAAGIFPSNPDFITHQRHGTLPAGQHEQQDTQYLQNYQPSEGPSMLHNQNYKVGATDVFDFPHGDHMNNSTEGGWLHSMLTFDESTFNPMDSLLHDESFHVTVDTSFQKPKALIQGMVWAFISLRKPRT